MFARLALAGMISASAAIAADAPPKVKLSVPHGFATLLTVKHYQRGQDLLDSPPYRLTTVAAMTEYHGFYGPRVRDFTRDHSWTVRVYDRFSPKIAAAYAAAKDGFEADLNESPEFLGLDQRSYMYARFARKRFEWGDAVSFFSQFTDDAYYHTPNNGHLTYEVWGVTHDRKYSVVATLSVTHSKLPNWGPEVRDAPSLKALKKDRHFKLIERCSAGEFQPSLTVFDRMLESLVIR
jgi:hypothetical protein